MMARPRYHGSRTIPTVPSWEGTGRTLGDCFSGEFLDLVPAILEHLQVFEDLLRGCPVVSRDEVGSGGELMKHLEGVGASHVRDGQEELNGASRLTGLADRGGLVGHFSLRVESKRIPAFSLH